MVKWAWFKQKSLDLPFMFLSNKLTGIGVLVLSALFVSCTPSQNMSENGTPVEFTEERRLNHSIDLPETSIIHTIKELTELYGKLEDPSFPRSAPIPPFDSEKESILVLKPILKELKYGEIQIENIEKSNATLTVHYREVESWESAENNWSDPIIILKVSEKPSKIKLNKIN